MSFITSIYNNKGIRVIEASLTLYAAKEENVVVGDGRIISNHIPRDDFTVIMGLLEAGETLNIFLIEQAMQAQRDLLYKVFIPDTAKFYNIEFISLWKDEISFHIIDYQLDE